MGGRLAYYTGRIIDALNKKIRGLRLNIFGNNNIDFQYMRHKGLQFNARGVGKFATDLVNNLRSL